MSFTRHRSSNSSEEGYSPIKQKRKRRKMADTVHKEVGLQEESSSGALCNIEEKLSDIVNRLDEMNSKFGSLRNKHNELDKDVNGEGGVSEEIENAKSVIGETQSDMSVMSDLIRENTHTMRILTSVVIKQNQQLCSARNELNDLKARSMRDNILIHNVPEGDVQGVHHAAVVALGKMNIDIKDTEFDRIHRLGPVRNDNNPRPIVAKPHRYKETERLLKSQKNKTDRKTSTWISPQFPEQVREERILLVNMAEDVRKKAPSAKIKLSHTTLTINGQQVKPTLNPPTPADILKLEKEEIKQLSAIKFIQSETINARSSSFIANGTTASNLNDVRLAYSALMLNPVILQATHNIAAYILPDGSSGYCDDQDYGMGRRMLQSLEQSRGKGIAVFITRQYGGNKLGSQRFEIARDLTNSVCKELSMLKLSMPQMQPLSTSKDEPMEETVPSSPTEKDSDPTQQNNLPEEEKPEQSEA